MGFDATLIPPIMLIIVGIGWMIVWAFRGSERESQPPQTQWHDQKRKTIDRGREYHYSVARSTSTPPDALERYSRASSAAIRRLVGQNPSTPRETLELLTSDEVDGVRSGVAKNPSTPPDLLQQLANDSSDRVRNAALMNARFIQVAPQWETNSGSRVDALERLARLHQQGALTEQEFKAEKERISRE